MKRRRFLQGLAAAGLAAIGATAWRRWPEPGFMNPCGRGLPETLARHPLLMEIWQGLNPALVWDCHVHLIGAGDSGTGPADTRPWFSPRMETWRHPVLRLQKAFYLNAGCIDETRMDASYVERMVVQLGEMRPGFKAMLLAFDWCHDEAGRPLPEQSVFRVPDAYAAAVAQRYPERFEWIASIHPYRPDAVDALQQAAGNGAGAVKWLPSAMNIDPASSRCDRFYRALAELGLPLLSHAGRELAVPGGSQDHGNPLRLRRALDQGVRVVMAHCASDGEDRDLDRGSNGPYVKSYTLFARMMADASHAGLLFGEISALTQFNRVWALRDVLQHREWHARLLNGSDYPLPGIMPLFSPAGLADEGLLDPGAVPLLEAIRGYNPLLFDFALKRLLRLDGRGFPAPTFETARFFARPREAIA